MLRVLRVAIPAAIFGGLTIGIGLLGSAVVSTIAHIRRERKKPLRCATRDDHVIVLTDVWYGTMHCTKCRMGFVNDDFPYTQRVYFPTIGWRTVPDVNDYLPSAAEAGSERADVDPTWLNLPPTGKQLV